MTKKPPIKTNVALPAGLLHAIGHVAALWGRLEFIIDGTIRHALDLPNAPQIDTSLILPFKKRLELLSDLLVIFLDERERTEWAEAFLADVKSLQSRRDLIVHGAVANSEQDQEGELVYWFRRVRWERPARILEKRAMTVAEVEALAMQISDQVAIAGLLELWMPDT
jgi:hypothetical protein